MKKLIAIFTVLSLISCKKEVQTFSKNITIIQDTVQNLKIKNIKEKDYATSNIMYIGKIKEIYIFFPFIDDFLNGYEHGLLM